MIKRVFDTVYTFALGSFGFFCGGFLLSDGHTDFEKLIVAGLYLLLMGLEFHGRD